METGKRVKTVGGKQSATRLQLFKRHRHRQTTKRKGKPVGGKHPKNVERCRIGKTQKGTCRKQTQANAKKYPRRNQGEPKKESCTKPQNPDREKSGQETKKDKCRKAKQTGTNEKVGRSAIRTNGTPHKTDSLGIQNRCGIVGSAEKETAGDRTRVAFGRKKGLTKKLVISGGKKEVIFAIFIMFLLPENTPKKGKNRGQNGTENRLFLKGVQKNGSKSCIFCFLGVFWVFFRSKNG